MPAPIEPTAVGRLTSVHGVKGWIKVYSNTHPRENIFRYNPWWVKTSTGWVELKVDQHRTNGKDLLIHLEGIDDRDEARLQCQQDIYIEKSSLPSLPEGEFYWHQLEGLAVKTLNGQQLGRVTQLMETGANDVLVVVGNNESIDQRERLIPYTDQAVAGIDLLTAEMTVDWDPDF